MGHLTKCEWGAVPGCLSDSKGCLAVDVQEYATAQDMMQSTCLKLGYAHTLGFYEVGDGGAAYYTVGDSGTPNGMDVLRCAKGLVAVSISYKFNDYVNLGGSTYFTVRTSETATLNALNILQRYYSKMIQICGIDYNPSTGEFDFRDNYWNYEVQQVAKGLTIENYGIKFHCSQLSERISQYGEGVLTAYKNKLFEVLDNIPYAINNIWVFN